MSLGFTETIQKIIQHTLESVHTSLPARIVEINEKDVDVQPTVALYRAGGNIELPVISNVPIMFPQTSKGGIQWELAVGDTVLLVFSEGSIDSWMAGDGSVVKAQNGGRYQLSDAIAIAGLSTELNTRKLNQDFGLQIGYEDTTVTIKKNGDVEIGGVGAQKLVNESFLGVYNGHTHTDPISGSTGIPSALMTETNLTSKTSAL